MPDTKTRHPVRNLRDADPTQDRATADRLHEANEQLRGATRWADAVAWLYRVAALAYGVATIYAIVALARPEVPLREGVQVVAVMTLLTVLLLVGAIEMVFSPVVWNIILAALVTFAAFLHAVGPNPLGLALPAALVLAALLWAALVPTLRFQRLISQHEDLFILHHASTATRRSLKGHTLEEQHERLVAARHRAAQRAWGASIGAAIVVVIVSVAASYAVITRMRPQELTTARAEFEAAWRSSDMGALSELYDPRVRDEWTGWLAANTRALGWAPKLPPLSGGKEVFEDDGAYIDYTAGGANVSARWLRSGPRWRLTSLTLPDPPFEPTLESFLAAWAASDREALAGHFAPDHRQSMVDLIADALAIRGWTTFPKVLDTTSATLEDGTRAVELIIEQGNVETRWHVLRDATWKLHYLKFPKR